MPKSVRRTRDRAQAGGKSCTSVRHVFPFLPFPARFTCRIGQAIDKSDDGTKNALTPVRRHPTKGWDITHATANSFDHFTFCCHTCLAVQPRLGLLPERNVGSGSDDPTHPDVAGVLSLLIQLDQRARTLSLGENQSRRRERYDYETA